MFELLIRTSLFAFEQISLPECSVSQAPVGGKEPEQNGGGDDK